MLFRSGRLAIKGPTGCRYLADERQLRFVQKGWNLPGDTFMQDDDGYLFYQARNDDMIVSAGYNISGPEVEAVLLDHPEVRVQVELFESDAYFFPERIPGPGGLPLGVEGRAVALLSGGFDSAVAAWQMLRRGVALDYV